MADITKTVEIIFGAKSDVAKITRSIEQNLENLTDPLSKAGTALAAFEAALSALAIGGMFLAVKTAGDFNNQFGEISTLLNDTGKPVENFKEDIKAYATESVKSISEINKAVYAAISAGIDYKDALTFLAAAEKLSVAGLADLGDTTKVLVSVLNAYGASANDAEKYSDLMFTTVRLGQTTLSELSASLAQVTGIAANSGIPFQTLSAAIAALTLTGMPTAQAITSIKAALSNIIKPTGEAEETAKSLGIQFNATALKTKGFETVLWDTWRATGGNIEKMAQLFGSVEGLNAVLVLGADKTGKFKTALTEMGNSAKVVQTAYEKVVDQFKNLNQRLENNFLVTLSDIGERILPGYGNIVNSLNKLFMGLDIGVKKGAFDPLFKALDDAGKNIADFIASIGKNFPEALKKVDFSGLVNSFKELAAAVARYIQTSNLDDSKGLADAMQFVVNTMKSLLDVTKGMGTVWAPFLDAVKGLIKAFNDLDTPTKDTIGNLLGLSMIFKMFGPFGLIMVAMGTDAQTMAKMFDVSFAAIENGMNSIKVAILSLATVFAHASKGMAELLDYVPGLDMTEDLKRTTDRVKLLDDMLLKANTDLVMSSDKVAKAFLEEGASLKDTKSKADEFAKTLGNIPGNVYTEVDLRHEAAHRAAEALKNTIDGIPGTREVVVGVQADGSTIEKAYGVIRQTFPDGTVVITNVGVQADDAKLAATKSKIKKELPDTKTLEIETNLKIATIKEQSDIVQKALEWKAKVDMAEVEGAFRVIEQQSKNIGTIIESTGDTLSSALETMRKDRGWNREIDEQVKRESDRRDRALQMQEDLTNAQLEYLRKKAAALSKGDALIKVDGSGLQPYLEAFMFEILKAIQIRANAEGAAFLTGL